MVSQAQELGKELGRAVNEQKNMRDNMSPDETGASTFIVGSDQLRLVSSVTVTKLVYASDSFILDHPTQGELDSAVYNLDGGYDGSQTEVIYTR